MLIFGCVLTALWIAGFAGVIYINFDDAIGLDLNEWGDFLAGSFAPLAFFWLVIGYFQQGKELRLSTKALMQQEVALRLQVSELKASVEQQKELVKAARDEMELTKSQLERQRKKEKIAAQPRVNLEMTHLKWAPGGKAFTVELSNSGAWLSNVTLKKYPDGLEVELKIDQSGRWGPDMTIHLEVFAPKDKVLECGDKLRILLDCLDGLGEQETIEIFLMVNENYRLIYSKA
ncbi:hypothetical protein [Pseudomonas sediminis]|uniref:PilZ domain-containing protein n=1 Tax=Pseudomonas sediminis TaxID=1691904 RepID=A0ABX6SBI7_9PSED|nr:hypothetical protein [Pseudomonas sediminis]QNG99170.1 hypothetical protein HNQ25_12630 [Pseudomonas sediminis]